MMRGLTRSTTTNENLTNNILGVVCAVGLLRAIIEMVRNAQTFGNLDSFLDVGYGIICSLALIALWRKAPYRFFYFLFFIPLIVLMCLTFYDGRGLAGSTENNIHIGLAIVALTMRRVDVLKFSIFLISGTLIVLVILELQHHFLESYTDYSTSHFNYIFMATGAIMVIFYAKRVFEKSKEELSQTRSQLSEKRTRLESSRNELETQTKELHTLNLQLEEKVSERILLLNNQRRAMKKYLDVTLKELQERYREVEKLAEAATRQSDSEISEMMLKSSQDLKNEINSLFSKLEEEQ